MTTIRRGGNAGADPDAFAASRWCCSASASSKAVAIGVSHVRGWRDPDDRLHSRLSDGLLIGAALLLLLPPLLAVIVDGINRNMLNVLAQPALWQALSTSLRIAIAAGLLSVTLTMMLLWSSRSCAPASRPLAGQAMELSGMLILAMPGIVLATGFFCCSVTASDCRSPPTASSSSPMP